MTLGREGLLRTAFATRPRSPEVGSRPTKGRAGSAAVQRLSTGDAERDVPHRSCAHGAGGRPRGPRDPRRTRLSVAWQRHCLTATPNKLTSLRAPTPRARRQTEHPAAFGGSGAARPQTVSGVPPMWRLHAIEKVGPCIVAPGIRGGRGRGALASQMSWHLERGGPRPAWWL